MKRLVLQGPNWNGHWEDYVDYPDLDPEWIMHKGPTGLAQLLFDRPWARWGFGSDEYGNPSVYFRCGWFGIMYFYSRYVQEDVEIPEPGVNAFVDKVYYREP